MRQARSLASSSTAGFHALPEASPHYSISEQLRIPLALRHARVDLFHAPHYVVPRLVPCPYVVTIHDCIHLRFPQYLPNRFAPVYARTMMRMAWRGSPGLCHSGTGADCHSSYSPCSMSTPMSVPVRLLVIDQLSSGVWMSIPSP